MSTNAFQNGLGCYDNGDYQEALQHFNEALQVGRENTYLILDSRAAVYAKLGQRNEALRDAEKAIDVAPDQWQGYARAARVLLQSNEPELALTMVKLSLERVQEDDTDRRVPLLELEADAQETLEMHRKRSTDHMSGLPFELFGDICRILVEENQPALIPLLHTSKHWRSAIDNTPYLWHTLILTERRPEQKAKMWIERSIGRLKELSVAEGASSHNGWPGDWLHGLQWEHLRILRTHKWQVVFYIRSINKPHALDNLDRVVLDDRDARYRITQHPFFSLHSEQLPLQHLAMFNVIFPLETVANRVKGLKTLELRKCIDIDFTKNWTTILVANPLLERLALESILSLTSVNVVDLQFDHLTYLEVVKNAPCDIYTANMPALRVLKLRSPRNVIPDVFIKHLVDTNVMHLTELVLQSCLFGDMPLVIALLKLSTNLQILEITNTSSGVTSIIKALAAHYSPLNQLHLLRDYIPTPPPICPKLAHVNFSSCTQVHTGPLIHMIKSRLLDASSLPNSQEMATNRIHKVSRIESLIIDECPDIDITWLPMICELVSHVSCVQTIKLG